MKESQPIWRKLDTAPRNGRPVLVFDPGWDSIQVGFYDEATHVWQAPSGDLIKVPAFWMPLPETPYPRPPEEGGA